MPTPEPRTSPESPWADDTALRDLLARCRGRAIGLWSRDPQADALVLRAFAAAGLDETVSNAFVAATRRVDLSRLDLGIVKAACQPGPVVSRAAELPDDAGSGHWLRAFGAAASVALGIRAETGANKVVGVLSVALTENPDDNQLNSVVDCLERAVGPMISGLSTPGRA